ncbi:MAG TPA: methionine--tRNA ligase, partial [Candidatus Paceibacterota bacterium]
FKKLDIRIGKILEAEIVPEADRLLKFKVDIGNSEVRTIISGVREHYPDPQLLVGKSVPVLTNLEPRLIKGIESQGMILYVVGESDNFTTLEPSKSVSSGTIVR